MHHLKVPFLGRLAEYQIKYLRVSDLTMRVDIVCINVLSPYCEALPFLFGVLRSCDLVCVGISC